MRTTILGGILFLAPVAVLAILLGKVFQISKAATAPLNNLLPVEQIGHIAVRDLLAIMAILVVCYLAGLLAKRAFLTRHMQRLEGLLIDLIPGYAIFKGMLGGMASKEEIAERMKPVLARFDDHELIAFEIERGETHCVLYLPGAPSAWSGTTVVVEKARITELNVPPHQAAKLMRVFGRGSLALRTDRVKVEQD